MSISSSAETSYRSAFLTLICLFIGVLRYLTYHSAHSLSSLGLHPYLMVWSAALDNGDNSAQRAAHAVFCCALAICILFLPKIAEWFSAGSSQTAFMKILASLNGTCLVLFTFSSFLYWTLNPSALCFGIFILFSYLCFSEQAKKHLFSWFGYKSLLICTGLAAIIPGLLVHTSLANCSPTEIVSIQNHYSTVVLQGDALAYGQKMFENVRPYYGILFALFTGLYERCVHELNFGNFVFILKILQVISLFACLALFVRFARGWNLASVLAFSLLLPWLHTNHVCFLYPNNSAFRWLGLVAAVAVLFLLKRTRGIKLSLMLGVSGAVNILWNTEIGLAVVIGHLAFLSLRENILRAGSTFKQHYLLLGFFAGLALSLLLFYGSLYLVNGSLPDMRPYMQQALYFAKLVAGGYSAAAFTYNPLALLMIAHMTYAALVIASVPGVHLFRNSLRYAIAATSLVWFAYYLNRADTMSLNSQYFLYGFFVIDLIRSVYLRSIKRKTFPESVVLVAAVISLVILPQIFDGFHNATVAYKAAVYRLMHREKDKSTIKLSGIELPLDVANQLQDKADFVKKLRKEKEVTYFTSDTVFIPKLSGVRSNIPFRDVFVELPLLSQSDKLCTDIVQQGPAELLFDDPSWTSSGDNARLDCFNYIKARIRPLYKPTSTVHGWQVWTRGSQPENGLEDR